MAAVSGRGVGGEQGCVVRVCRVAGQALLVEVVLGRSERVGGGAARRGAAGWQDGGGLQSCTLTTCGGVEFGMGVEGWRVIVCGWREEGEGVCFCGHCCIVVGHWWSEG